MRMRRSEQAVRYHTGSEDTETFGLNFNIGFLQSQASDAITRALMTTKLNKQKKQKKNPSHI